MTLPPHITSRGVTRTEPRTVNYSVVECRHCGKTEWYEDPLLPTDWQSILRQFAREHAACKPETRQ